VQRGWPSCVRRRTLLGLISMHVLPRVGSLLSPAGDFTFFTIADWGDGSQRQVRSRGAWLVRCQVYGTRKARPALRVDFDTGGWVRVRQRDTGLTMGKYADRLRPRFVLAAGDNFYYKGVKVRNGDGGL
jgi:hypothetical protein